MGRGWGRMRGKVQGLRSTNWQVLNRQGDVKNSIRNGEATERMCMTHGHELRGGLLDGGRMQGRGAQRGDKIQDNRKP